MLFFFSNAKNPISFHQSTFGDVVVAFICSMRSWPRASAAHFEDLSLLANQIPQPLEHLKPLEPAMF